MGGCSTGRSTQKYTGGGGADLSSILTAHGDMIYADQNIEAANVSIGQTMGHVLTIVSPGQMGWAAVSGGTGSVGNLEQVTTNAANTSHLVRFFNTTTSLSASGNVLVSGNVTASKFIGSGVELSGVALDADLADNVIRISNLELANGVQANLITDITTDLSSNVGRIASLESNALMTSSSTLGTIQSGDLLYGASTNSLSNLSIGSIGDVLTVDNSGMPSWASASGGATQWIGTNTLYFTGNVGIGTSDVSKTLSVGSNVFIKDTTDDKLNVTGNVYVSKSLRAIDRLESYEVRANFFTVKNIDIKAERPRRGDITL